MVKKRKNSNPKPTKKPLALWRKVNARFVFFLIMVFYIFSIIVACNAPVETILPPYQLSTRCGVSEDLSKLGCAELSDVMNADNNGEKLSIFRFKNNRYDTIFIPLQRSTACSTLYFMAPEIGEEYKIIDNKAVLVGSGIQCSFGIDSLLKVTKGDSIEVFYLGYCSSDKAYFQRYRSSFQADSGHIRTEIKLHYPMTVTHLRGSDVMFK